MIAASEATPLPVLVMLAVLPVGASLVTTWLNTRAATRNRVEDRERSDALRWAEERRVAYIDLLEAASAARRGFSAWKQDEEAMSGKRMGPRWAQVDQDAERLDAALEHVGLIGSDAMRDAARNMRASARGCFFALALASMDESVHGTTDVDVEKVARDYDEAVERVREAARADLEVSPRRPSA